MADDLVVDSEVTDEPRPLPAKIENTLPAVISGVPNRAELADMLQFGKVLCASGMFSDLQGAAQAVVKIIAGRTFGLDPIQSQTAFQMVQGRLSQAAKFQSALIRRSPLWRIVKIEHDDKVCELAFFTRERLDDYKGSCPYSEWEEVGRSRFTIQDAVRAQLGKSKSGAPGAWQMYPSAMLYARALTQGATWYCPHLLLGPGFAPGHDGDDLVGVDEDSAEE